MALIHYLQLSLADGVGPITISRLIEAFGSAESAVAASYSDLQSVQGIGSTKSRAIHSAIKAAASAAEAEVEKAQRIGVRLICPEDSDYPALLKEIPDPPAVLYMKGNLEPRDLNGLAIVGSRRCSYYGREQAERFAALLAGAGFTVISGGARGIDSAAHRGALQQTMGRTIAVLGSGIDVPYPAENANLFEQIATRGAVLSEYPLGTPPLADNFPRRNRIVSGMSRGVLVIEADVKSGALITARQCIEDHNRPVFAVPGRVDNAMSAGPHKLIREGAVLTANIEDILDALGPLPDSVAQVVPEIAPADERPLAVKPEPIHTALSDSQRAILQHMDRSPVSVDTLVERTTLPAHSILKELTFLSLKGLIKRIDGQTYVRK